MNINELVGREPTVRILIRAVESLRDEKMSPMSPSELYRKGFSIEDYVGLYLEFEMLDYQVVCVYSGSRMDVMLHSTSETSLGEASEAWMIDLETGEVSPL